MTIPAAHYPRCRYYSRFYYHRTIDHHHYCHHPLPFLLPLPLPLPLSSDPLDHRLYPHDYQPYASSVSSLVLLPLESFSDIECGTVCLVVHMVCVYIQGLAGAYQFLFFSVLVLLSPTCSI